MDRTEDRSKEPKTKLVLDDGRIESIQEFISPEELYQDLIERVRKYPKRVVFAEGEEEAGDEGGGRRLAVGAADGDGFAGTDEFGEDLAAVADAAGAGGFAGEGGGELGVVAADGGREDDLVGVRDVRGVVSDGDGDAQGGEPAGTRRGVEVASRDLVTLRLQQHGESRHADPADTGEMNLFSVH